MAAVIGWRRKWVAGGDEIVNGHTMLDDRGALGATDDSQRRKQQSAIYLLHGGSGGGQGLAKRAPRGIDWRLVTKAGVRGRGEDGPIATVRCRCGGRGEGEGSRKMTRPGDGDSGEGGGPSSLNDEDEMTEREAGGNGVQ